MGEDGMPFRCIVCVMRSRLLSSRPFAREMRTTNGDHLVAEGGACQKGEETETDLPTVPPSHLAECLPVGEATSSPWYPTARRPAPTPAVRTSCTRHGTNRSPGRQSPWRK